MNIEKRVKRHIWAQEHEFLLTLPGALREICAAELAGMGIDGRIVDEGIRLEGRLETAYRILNSCRTASRVWLVPPDFKAGALEELFRKTARIFWELLISPDIPLRTEARVRRSRIEHEGETAATVLKAIRHRFAEQGLSPPRGLYDPAPEAGGYQRVRIAAENDRVELRIDLTGDHLHRRGYRRAFVDAPLRETLAAGLVMWSIDRWRERNPGTQWPRRVHDPFCGSGTVAIEAALLAEDRAPGTGRDFLCMRQPSLREPAFNHIRSRESSPAAAPRFRVGGSDIDADAVRAAAENGERAGVAIDYSVADALGSGSAEWSGSESLIITNPPYGERLSEGGTALYGTLLARLEESGSAGVVLVPEKLLPHLPIPPDAPRLAFDNGGIPVIGVYYQR